MAEDLPDDVASMLQEFIEEHHEYLSWIGTRVDDISRGSATMTIPFDEKLTNPTTPPTMQGGIAATLIDTAGGMACRSALDDPFTEEVATINLNVNYLRRAATDITAHAEVVRAGGSVGWANVFVESEPPDGETETVAVGQGAYRLFRSRD
ncbi:MAG: PaaI family thioesterase [Haloarculaceae archaeon]